MNPPTNVIERYPYRGFHGCASWCGLEIIRLRDGRTVVIATEVEDNPGTSVTNMAEGLASRVCAEFTINPRSLVWIEHYGYPSAFPAGNPRTFDLVTFARPMAGDGAPFGDPKWRPMSEGDWRALSLPPRRPVEYRS